MLGRQIYVSVSRCGQRCLRNCWRNRRLPWEAWGDLRQRCTLSVCRVSRQRPPAETQPGLGSWPRTEPNYSHELIFRACILNKELNESKPFAFAVFSFLRAKDDGLFFFFLLASKQCYFHPKTLLFQPTADEWSGQNEASPCRGGREAGGGKETPVSLLTQGLRKLKSPSSFSFHFFTFVEICPPSASSD